VAKELREHGGRHGFGSAGASPSQRGSTGGSSRQEPRPPEGEDDPRLSTLFHQLSIRRQANRGDKTAIELFLAGVKFSWSTWQTQIAWFIPPLAVQSQGILTMSE